MVNLLKSYYVLAAVTIFVSCTSNTIKNNVDREPAGAASAFSTLGPVAKVPESLDDSEVSRTASSDRIQFSRAMLLTDNDAAFESKLFAINSARPGETIRLSYYIYSDDHSSSVFNKALIEAAQRGVKVKLIADLLTNYKHYDLFRYFIENGRGNFQVKFYGRPSAPIVRDVVYSTLPCPPEKAKTRLDCKNAKNAIINAANISDNDRQFNLDIFAKMALAGLYSKGGTGMKLAIGYGAQIDAAGMKESQPQDPAVAARQKEGLKQIGKLVFQAKVKGEVTAYIKLMFAMQAYPEVLPIMNQIYGRLPVNVSLDKDTGAKSTKHWDHISDFSHQKLLLVTDPSGKDRLIQLGGRNIENSYHMKQLMTNGQFDPEVNELNAKYIFMDTDMFGEISSYAGSRTVAKAFDEMWNFNAMLISLEETDKVMPFDLVAIPDGDAKVRHPKGNFGLIEIAAGACMQRSDLAIATGPKFDMILQRRAEFAKCLESQLTAERITQFRALRAKTVEDTMNENAQKYMSVYKPKLNLDPQSTHFNSSQGVLNVNGLSAYYIQNTPYTKLDKTKRRIGEGEDTVRSRLNPIRPEDSGRDIHALWEGALENVCAASQRQPKRVILHNAYWLPPSDLVQIFGKMVDGSWRCSNVTVDIVTNSFATTDLNVVNLIAKYQMLAFFQIYKNSKSQHKATFRYFEYNKSAVEGDRFSLHSKVSLLGDDFIVGSANADVRSYYMDSNNGFFIRGNQQLISEYTSFIDRKINNPSILTEETGKYTGEDLAQVYSLPRFKEMDQLFIDALYERFKFIRKIKKEDLFNFQQSVAADTYQTTRYLLGKDLEKLGVTKDSADFNIKKRDAIEKARKGFLEMLSVF